MGDKSARFWETLTLDEMNEEQWEALCDGCALCCMLKVEDEDTGEIFYTDVACKLLDLDTCRCMDYANRVRRVADCLDLSSGDTDAFEWLPASCAYRRLAKDEPLPEWHPLITGDPDSVHDAGISVRGKVVSEREATGWSILWNVSEMHEDQMNDYPTIPLVNYEEYPVEEMRRRAQTFYESVSGRRTVREFSDREVPLDIIETALKAAGTAPSGANLQPWHFVVVSGAETRKKIREAAEAEEREFYEHRASEEWLAALAPLGTDESKPFLETAPYLIAIFLQKYAELEDGTKVKHYYPVESTGIATGILITALHEAGLVTLTHTPSPMRFLSEILDRPKSERPFLLLVVGYPADDARVPDIDRKPLEAFTSFVDE